MTVMDRVRWRGRVVGGNDQRERRQTGIFALLHRLSVIIGTRISTSRCRCRVLWCKKEGAMEMATFTAFRIPLSSELQIDAEEQPDIGQSRISRAPFPTPSRCTNIRWPQSTPPHRPTPLLGGVEPSLNFNFSQSVASLILCYSYPHHHLFLT